MADTATTPIDYAALYKSIESQGNVPYASSQSIAASRATFQGMYLDLAEIKSTLAGSGFDPPLVVVYADVLNIPDSTTWMLQQSGLVIVARRIQAAGTATISLDFRSDHSATLVVFTSEMAGSITAVAVLSTTDAQTFPVNAPPDSGGVQIAWVGSAPAAVPRVWAQGMSVPPENVFQQALITEFIFATLLSDQQPALALAQLTWLKNWSGAAPQLLNLFLRTSSLLSLLSAQVNAKKNGAAFVPYLTQDVYAGLADAFSTEAGQYESTYRTLSTQKAVDDQFIQLATTLLANQTSQSEYVTTLLGQAKLNYDNAVAAVDAAQVNFGNAQRTAQSTQINFEKIGIPLWEEKKIIDAVISLGTAVITFGVGIAGMLAGDPAGGAAGAKAAVDTAEAVEQAAEAGTQIATMAKQLADTMAQLKKIVEALQKVYEFLKQVVLAAQNIQNAQKYADKMKGMDVSTGGADLSATYQWQIYQQTTDALLADPVQQGIGYASDLKLAIDNVAVYGQALAAAQLAAVTAGQQYAEVQLQRELALQQQAELQQYVDSLQTGEQPVVAMMQQFYQRYVDAKSSLYAAIQGYRASYFYWALDQSMITPRIIDDVDSLDTGLGDLTKIALDKTAALQHFKPPPQTLTRKQLVIDDPALIAELAKTGAVKWALTLDSPAFAGFDRSRLTLVRAWLEGAKPQGGGADVLLTLSTSGNYLDRLGGTNFQFTSDPLARTFEYSVSPEDQGGAAWKFDDGTYGYVEVDGAVDREVSYAYFEPTPFSEWQLTVSQSSPVDVSAVTKVTLIFAGSVIPQKGASLADESTSVEPVGSAR
jgi:hypothetical protein